MSLSPAARFGLHRVLDERGGFPQPAWRLDSDPRISDAELLVDVECLNLDSASFRQLSDEGGRDPARISGTIERIVAERGKMHNPVIGSGGMLIGTVREVGSGDATDALGLYEAVMQEAGVEADVSVNLVNVGGSELATILLTRETGTILFFSMATSFTVAALGAEGLGRATTMIIGNGHMPDMGLTAMAVLRENPVIHDIFRRRCAR